MIRFHTTLLIFFAGLCTDATHARTYVGGVSGADALAVAANSEKYRADGGHIYLHHNGWGTEHGRTTAAQQDIIISLWQGHEFGVELGYIDNNYTAWQNILKAQYLDKGISPVYLTLNAFSSDRLPNVTEWGQTIAAYRTIGVTCPIYATFEYQNFPTKMNTLMDNLVSDREDFQQIIAASGGLTLDTPPTVYFKRINSSNSATRKYHDWVIDAIHWARDNGHATGVIISPNDSKTRYPEDTEAFIAILRAEDAMPDFFIVENYSAADPETYTNIVGNEDTSYHQLGCARLIQTEWFLPEAIGPETPLNITSVSASSFHDDNVPQNTLDHNLDTRWSAQGEGQWIEFTLEEPATVAQVWIAWLKGHERSGKFEIETSLDGIAWTTVYADLEGASSLPRVNLQVYDVSGSDAQYIRIIGYGNRTNDWNSITAVAFASPLPPGLVRQWNFNIPGDVEGWTSAGSAHPNYALTQATSIDGSTGVMTMAGPLVEGFPDPQTVFAPSLSLADVGARYTEWDKIVFRVRQFSGTEPVAWSSSGTTALMANWGPAVGNFGPGIEGKAITTEVQDENWILFTWVISSMGSNDLSNIRIDFVGNNVNAGKNFEVDYIHLYAVEPEAPQALWRLHFFGTTVDTGNAAMTANPDGDAYNNWAEYILGTNPTVPDVDPPLEIERTGASLTLAFESREATGPGYDGLSRYYTVEYSEDLSTWHELDAACNFLGDSQRIAIDLPAGVENQKFFRLRVWLEEGI